MPSISPPLGSAEAKAEGVTFLSEEWHTDRCMIVAEGADNGGATMFRCMAWSVSKSADHDPPLLQLVQHR